jgi:5-methylcytosine-specific restriction endonuclease McrA
MRGLTKSAQIGKPTRKKLRKECWELCKQIVFLRDKKCQRCGKAGTELKNGEMRGGLETAHIIGKGAVPKMYYDLDNLTLLCWQCHIAWGHHNPCEFTEWVKYKFGEKKYAELRLRAEMPSPKMDLNLLLLGLKHELERIKKQTS